MEQINYYATLPNKQEITFKYGCGTFSNYYKALGWLKENGYRFGSMSWPFREIAVVKGEKYNLPQKWKNMSKEQRNQVDGVIFSHDYREGEVKIILFE